MADLLPEIQYYEESEVTTPMKKKVLLFLLVLSVGVLALGCGKKEEAASSDIPEDTFVADEPEEEEAEEAVPVEEEPEEEETREGMYRSELTNEWIDESLKNQRPIAVMVDNEKTALPHYGLTQADVVYEMMNSTLNGHITRFMVLFKDYNSVKQIGSVRSVRPTNLQIAPDWNAIVCHDGGPFYIDAHLKNPYVDHFSGTFSRVNNGKPREFTEYILTGDMEKNFKNNSKVDREYNQYYEGPHYQFASESKPVDLSQASDSFDCTKIDLPFEHNGSELNYDSASGTYLYSEYGAPHLDAGNGNKQLAFKNILIQNTTYHQFDEHGYMIFYSVDSGREGYYITNGKAIPVTWTKTSDTSPTRYYDKDGNEITINTGKTYVALVADEFWSQLVVK